MNDISLKIELKNYKYKFFLYFFFFFSLIERKKNYFKINRNRKDELLFVFLISTNLNYFCL